MRFKITLELDSQAFGTVLPISYQYELFTSVNKLITSNMSAYVQWLDSNGFTLDDDLHFPLYSVSNLYVPKIFVKGDRLQINVPRVQFWISVYPELGTREFLASNLVGKSIVIGDWISRVLFRITAMDDVSPVEYKQEMEYQTLSPVVVKGERPNGSIEYLPPTNHYFPEFFVQALIERWEQYNRRPYTGNRSFRFVQLQPEKRKAVSVNTDRGRQMKVIGYMLKFRLYMDPQLQELAYVCGLGDCSNMGFGYLELLKKSPD